MAVKDWRGDAVARAQVWRITPSDVEIGDTFTVTCNGKSITVTATAATVANVVSLLVAAIAASTIPEFLEITATADGTTSVLLTASTPGVPFVVTVSASNGGSGGVTVSTTTQGGAPASSVQAFTIPSGATGTWTVAFGGAVTGAMAVGASAATVQTAIEGLSTIGAGQVSVARTSNTWAQSSYVYTVTFQGTLANQGVAMLVVAVYNAAPIINVETAGSPIGWPTKPNEIVRVLFPDSDVSAFTFTLTWNAQTSAATAYTSGIALPVTSISWPSLHTLTGSVVQTYVGDNLYTLEFKNELAAFDVGAVTCSATWSAAQGRFDIAVTESTVGSPGGNEVQLVTITTVPTGGTFTLTYAGQTTSNIAYNASAATVDAALEALSNIGAGDVAVTGSAGGPWTVTFGTALANTNVAQMTGSGALLTGGAAQAFALAAVTSSSGPNHYDEPLNWLPTGVPITGDAVRFLDSGDDCLYGLDQTGVVLASLTVSMEWANRKLGLQHVNKNGYLEYRCQQLTLGATVVVIGSGEGTGPSRVYLNTLATVSAVDVRNSGASQDAQPAIVWTGTHTSNSVVISDGDFGTSGITGFGATLDSLVMYGGSCLLVNAAVVNTLKASGNTFRSFGSTLGGKVLEI